MSSTSSTVSHVETPDLLTQPSVHGVQDITNDRWSGMLIWPRGESEVSASVQATDTVLDPCAHFLVEILPIDNLLVRLNRMLSTWPTHLRLEIIATGVHTLDIQALLFQHRAPVARIQCAPEMDNRDLDELINSLRERTSVRRSGSHPRLSLTD
jgi:hypothetical protein